MVSYFEGLGFSSAQQMVLDSALVLFVEKGFFKTTIPDLVKHSGVSTGSIYHAFKGKEDLAVQLMEALLKKIEQDQQAIFDSASDSPARYLAMADWLLDSSVRFPHVMRFVLYAAHREFMPEMKPLCSSKPFANFRRILEQGMAEGEVRSMDLMVATASAFGGILRMIQLSIDEMLPEPIQHYRDEIVEAGWLSVSCHKGVSSK